MDEQSFIQRGRRIKMAAEIGLVRSSRGGTQWSRALHRRLLLNKELAAAGPPRGAEDTPTSAATVEDYYCEEAAEVEQRVRALQRLVPGGEEMAVDRLLEETTDYIEALQGQVSAMRALSAFLDELEKQKRMMGG